MMLTMLADLARSTGHPVTEVPGWRTRTRPAASHGLVNVQTITIHETGLGFVPTTDMPSLGVLTNGRAGANPLPGPLVQFGIGVSGRIYVVAAGLCNHAGVSLLSRFTREHAVGIEIEASGLGLPGDFPDVQMDAAARLAAALQDRFPGSAILGHKETCKPVGRKVDPHFSMPDFRRRAARLSGTTPSTEDDDMDLSKAQIDQIAAAVWARQHALTQTDAASFGGAAKIGDKKSEGELLRYPPAVARLRRETTALIGAQNATLRVLANAIAAGGSLTADQAEAAAEAGARAALAKLGDLLDDDPVT